MQKKLINTIEQDVKFSEVDSLGIVWHGHYVRYFEDGREAFGKQHNLSYLDYYGYGYVVPIVNMQLDYKKFLRYGDRIIIETTYTPCEPAKLIFSYRLMNAVTGEVIVTGSTLQVFLSKDGLVLQLTNPDFFPGMETKTGPYLNIDLATTILMSMEQVDVLVIGAGPAGTVAASIINKAGFKVKIVEKQKFPRFVIGESLLPRCMEALTEAGFLDAVKEKGFQEKSGAKFVKNGKICDYYFADQFTPGWNWTWQVPRAEFDKTLADTVESMGVPIAYETTVTNIVFNGSDSVTTVEDINGNKTEIAARFIVDGSGYGRVIPRMFNLDKPSNFPSRKALFAHTVDVKRLMDDEPNRITIVVHKPGIWVWVIPFSNGITSVGFVGSPEFFEAYEGSKEEMWRELVSAEPYLAERLKNVELALDVQLLQAWSISTDKFYGDGFVLTGNVTEFLDPIFSSGVTLATVSSQTAAHLVIRKLKGEVVDWEEEYTKPLLQGVNTFRSYVTAWYEGTLDTIFFAKSQNHEIKKMICSVLAGYVWDKSNPFVRDHAIALKRLARTIQLEELSDEEV